MALPGKTTERFIFLGLYAGVIAVIAWGGIRMINRSLESRYYHDYLLKWEVSLRAFGARGGTWPRFKGGDHVAYMDTLIARMRKKGISLPAANRQRPYLYRIDLVGWRTKENTFILCFPDKVILYGLSKETFYRLDGFIDETLNPRRGRFTGNPGKEGRTYTGRWRL